MPSKQRLATLGSASFLGLIAASQTVAASTGAGTPMLPEWAIYVALAVLCPEDLNHMVKSRVSGKNEGNSNDA